MNAFELVKQNVKIEDYAAYLGMHVVRRGNVLTTKEHDSLVIRPDRNLYYRNATQRGGSIIDFVMEFTEHDTPSKAVAHLLDLYGMSETDRPKSSPAGTEYTDPAPKARAEIQLPERAENFRRLYGYLSGTRRISPAVIGHMIKHGYLYQDRRNNCVFVGRDSDGKVCYGMLRSTYSEGTFKGDLPGCDYDKGMLVSHGADTLVVTEAAIDAMSYMDLTASEGGNYKDRDYLILGSSTKWKALRYRLETGSYGKVILALDNDDAGRLGIEKMKDLLRELDFPGEVVTEVPRNNDWNDDLREQKEHDGIGPERTMHRLTT